MKKRLVRMVDSVWWAAVTATQLGLPVGIIVAGTGLGVALGVAGGHFEAAMHQDTADLLELRLIGCSVIGGIAGLILTLRWMCGTPLKDETNA